LQTVSGLRLVGAVGRARTDEGTPFGGRLTSIPAGETRRFQIPFTIAAPAWGLYRVRGSVYGLTAPVTFNLEHRTEPWGLEVGLPLALFALAQVLRWRERARAGTAQAEVESRSGFPESSPDVGIHDGAHWQWDPYDQPGMGPDLNASRGPDAGREPVLADGRR
jgi:hypothetical protein